MMSLMQPPRIYLSVPATAAVPRAPCQPPRSRRRSHRRGVSIGLVQAQADAAPSRRKAREVDRWGPAPFRHDRPSLHV